VNIKAWNALLVIALLIVLAGGGYILYQNNIQKQQEVSEEEALVLAQEKEEADRLEQERLTRLQGFEGFLNNFLQEVQVQAVSYKKSRAVLNELSKPSNLGEPEYIEENARLAESTVMSLQLQMDDIMSIFGAADQQAQDLIHQFEGETQLTIQKNWTDVRDQNTTKYTAFFAMEQDVLMAQLKLIEFYAEHREVLSVDVANDRVLFESVELQEQEALLRGEIIELKASQKDVLKAASANN